MSLTSPGTEDLPTTYTNGPKDFCTIFFYSMAWIVVHAIIQEYIWDVSTLLSVKLLLTNK